MFVIEQFATRALNTAAIDDRSPAILYVSLVVETGDLIIVETSFPPGRLSSSRYFFVFKSVYLFY